MKTAINIIILGKTGVGKSSFCNYIFGDKLFKTGAGKPITQSDEHFQNHQISYNTLDLNLIDTVGIETDNFAKLKMSLKAFIQKRNGNPFTKPKEWVHGIFYLINAASARLEDPEIALLHSLKQQQIPIHIVLTNIDTAGKDKIEALKDCILKENIVNSRQYINEVCSVSIKTRAGTSSVQTGKDEVLKSFLHSLSTRLKQLIIYYHLINTFHLTQLAKDKVIKSIKKADLGAVRLIKSAINDELNDIIDPLEKLYDQEQLDIYSQYATEIDQFLDSIEYRYEASITQEIRDHEDKVESLLETGLHSFESVIKEIEYGFNSDNLWDNVVAGVKATKIILTLESTLFEQIDVILDPILTYLKTEISRYDTGSSNRDIELTSKLPGLKGPLYTMLKR